MVGSLNTTVTVCRTAAQERKSISTAIKVIQNTPIKKDRLLPNVFNSSWIQHREQLQHKDYQKKRLKKQNAKDVKVEEGTTTNKQQILYEDTKHTETSKGKNVEEVQLITQFKNWRYEKKKFSVPITNLCSGRLRLQGMNISHLPYQKFTLYPDFMPQATSLVAKISVPKLNQ